MKKMTPILLAMAVASAQSPLSLKEAARTGLEKHPMLAAAGARGQAAGARVDQARAGRLPQVTFQESATGSNNPVFVFSSLLSQRRFSAGDFALNSLNRPSPLGNFQSLLSAEHTLFDGGKIRHETTAAQLDRDAQDQERKRLEIGITANVARTYFAVHLAEEQIQVARNALVAADADWERARNRRDAGMSTDADVLSVEVHRAGMQDRLTRAQSELEVAQASLNEAMGVPLEDRYRLTTPLAEIHEPLSFTAKPRPEEQQTELAQRSAGERLAVAKSARLPQISLRSSFEADRGRFINQGGANWTVAGTLRWNIFNGFADRARIDEASTQISVADAEKRRVEQGVRLETMQAESAFREAASRIESAAAIIRSADESLRITRNRYESGLATVTDLLRTENAALEARLRRLEAVYDQRLAAVAWALATGNLNGDANVLE